MEDSNDTRDVVSRLATIRERLAVYETEQRELLAQRRRTNDHSLSARAERGRLMERRGCLMYPPAAEIEVAAFEARAGIELPEDYRRFILEVGNGGEGPPDCGLLPLGATPENDVPGYLRQGYGDLLRRPFPFVEHWIWEAEEPVANNDARHQAVSHGNLVLGHDGCGQYWSLVVSGNQRGQMWQLTDVGIQPCAPSVTFLKWYEYWLAGGDDWWRDLYPDEEADPAAEPEEPAAEPEEPAASDVPRRPWWRFW